jgi:hypothetical protein
MGCYLMLQEGIVHRRVYQDEFQEHYPQLYAEALELLKRAAEGDC